MDNEKQTTHELSLWDLCLTCLQGIGRFLAWAYRTALSILRLSLHAWYIVLPLTLAAGAAGLYCSRMDNRIYKVGTMVHLSGVTRADVNQVYTSLTYALPGCVNAAQSLDNQLQLDGSQIGRAYRFETFDVIDYRNDSIPDVVDFERKHDMADTVNVIMPNYLYLSFRTKTPQLAQTVGNAIVAYLNRNAGLQAGFQSGKAVLERQSQFCHEQIEKLDSLTSAFYFEQAGSGQIQSSRWASALVVGDRSIDILHPDILPLFVHTEYIDRELGLATAPVVALNDFMVHPHAVNGPIKCTVLALMLGYLLGCAIAYAWKKRKDLLEWVQTEE